MGNIMIQGTMSGAGKSLVAAALCRILHQDGLCVAPFKSQNMSLNSCVTPDGREMGRAQAVQAQAAGLLPDADMNPVLLKPSGDTQSQLIVNGKAWGHYRAADYFRMKKSLIPEIMAAYRRLEEKYDVIVIEGAGSPAEINLMEGDIVNMGLARMVDAPVLLVGDIDRGGVFAQLYGTVALLPRDRQRIKGLIINKFRGDAAILEPGLAMLKEKTGIPVIGVIPYLDVDIDEEDSLTQRRDRRASKPIDIALIRLPRISNETDFAPLSRHSALDVRPVKHARELKDPDLIILPGTKNTMKDLIWLRETGLEEAVCRKAAGGTPVMGICGGYQMLGERISDPEGVENGGELKGMGLLGCETVFTREKRLARVNALLLPEPFAGCSAQGYEIHMGQTTRHRGTPFALPGENREEGTTEGTVYGTYLHGLFDSGTVVNRLAGWLLERKGMPALQEDTFDHEAWQERQLDLLADAVRQALDMEMIRKTAMDRS